MSFASEEGHQQSPPPSRLAVGLMSGTSLDGIDAVLVEIADEPFSVRTPAARCERFDAAAKEELTAIARGQAGTDELARAHVALGHLYAEAVEALLRQAGVGREEVDVIGCHGQTVRHLPRAAKSLGIETRATLQIGDAATLAERTGITVVSNFRQRDMAAGGEGAPLVPLLDYLLFADASVGRVALNIGGIANATFLPPGAGPDGVVAFDTGPGNVLLDLLAASAGCGGREFDRGGEIAKSGRIIESVLGELLSHPFLRRQPPKSTGPEEFGAQLLKRFSSRDHDAADLMATLVLFTARSVADAVKLFWPGERAPAELIASGGGVHNAALMDALRVELEGDRGGELGGIAVRSSAEFGLSPDYKEAVAFAVLADRTLRGLPGNLPSATGARHPVILGQITPAG